jgi:hypothetical protein
MAGFGQVLIAMGVVLWLAHRHGVRRDGSKPIVEPIEQPTGTGPGDGILVGVETRR